MALLPFSVTTEGEIALAAATVKTILQVVAPTNQRVSVRGFSLAFDGISGSAEPVQVELVRQTTAGVMTAATPVKDDDSLPEAIQTTAQKTATTEPTTTDVLRRYDVHPQTGYERAYAVGELTIKGGGRLGLRCTAPAIVNVTGHISLEE